MSPTKASLAVAALLLLASALAAGCGVFTQDDARKAFPDAAATGDTGSPRDVTTERDGTTDTGSSEGPVDGGFVDATTGDAATNDAAGSDGAVDAAGDVRPGLGFCATAVLDASAVGTFYCEDFDEGAGTPTNSYAQPPSTLTVESTVARSTPNALAVVTDPAVDASTNAFLDIPLQPGNGGYFGPAGGATWYRVEFDMQVTQIHPPSAGGETILLTMQWLSSGGGSEVALNLDVGDAGTPTITVTNAVGTTSYAHPSYPITLGPAWRHVAIKVALNGTWQDTLSVDGTVLETSSLAAGFSNTGTPATLTLGFPFVRGVGTRSLYLDNVLVESH